LAEEEEEEVANMAKTTHTLPKHYKNTQGNKKNSQSNKEGCFSLVVWCIVIDTKRSTRRRRW
jgi:hypothetical protein